MILGRRDKPTRAESLRVLLWPRRSWSRSGQYVVKRILRMSGSPYVIAAGVAAGVFTSFTPFIGFHFIIASLLAILIRGNPIAAVIATWFGNPITYPFIWGGTLALGSYLMGRPITSDQAGNLATLIQTESFAAILPTIQMMAVGAIPLGLTFGAIFYGLTRKTTGLYQKRRKAMLAEKAHERGLWRETLSEQEKVSRHPIQGVPQSSQ